MLSMTRLVIRPSQPTTGHDRHLKPSPFSFIPNLYLSTRKQQREASTATHICALPRVVYDVTTINFSYLCPIKSSSNTTTMNTNDDFKKEQPTKQQFLQKDRSPRMASAQKQIEKANGNYLHKKFELKFILLRILKSIRHKPFFTP